MKKIVCGLLLVSLSACTLIDTAPKKEYVIVDAEWGTQYQEKNGCGVKTIATQSWGGGLYDADDNYYGGRRKETQTIFTLSDVSRQDDRFEICQELFGGYLVIEKSIYEKEYALIQQRIKRDEDNAKSALAKKKAAEEAEKLAWQEHCRIGMGKLDEASKRVQYDGDIKTGRGYKNGMTYSWEPRNAITKADIRWGVQSGIGIWNVERDIMEKTSKVLTSEKNGIIVDISGSTDIFSAMFVYTTKEYIDNQKYDTDGYLLEYVGTYKYDSILGKQTLPAFKRSKFMKKEVSKQTYNIDDC